jgi:catechol 2,3-dioxygenase
MSVIEQALSMTGTGRTPAPGFRLPVATRLGVVRLQVSDLDRSLAYYTRVLGLRIASREGRTVRLAPQGDEQTLVELREQPGAPPASPRGRLGLFHFALLLPTRADLGRFLRHLVEAGMHPGASDHHVSEALYLRDPDGLGIEVYADRPRSAWRRTGAELHMETAPLDLESLLRDAGASAWSGIPAGTSIGHMHLHVGNLDEAEAYYHGALGLDPVVWSYPGALFLSAGGYHHHLGVNTWAGPRAVPPAPDEARLLEWELVLPTPGDVATAAGSLKDAGHSAEPLEDGSLVTHDPWGTRLRLVAKVDTT